MKKRTWHFAYHPYVYEIKCTKCGEKAEITWSEWQEHIWCYKCEEDIEITGSILNGPIPIMLAAVVKIAFDRIIIETGEFDAYNIGAGMWESELKKIGDDPRLQGIYKDLINKKKR